MDESTRERPTQPVANLLRNNGFSQHLRLLALALLTGLCTGVLALGFRYGAHALMELQQTSQQRWSDYAWMIRLLFPAAGALFIGVLLYAVLRFSAGHGVPAVIQSSLEDRPLDKPMLLVSAASSSVIIGTGNSAGPEGPIVELGAVAGSYIWRWFRLPSQSIQTLVGCGAAAGMAAVFSAPIGGVIFVLEVVLRDFRLQTLAPVMLASVAASTLTTTVLHLDKAIDAPSVTASDNQLLAMILPIALAGAIVGVLFILVSERMSGVVNRLRMPAWLKPAMGGLIVGAIALQLPAVEGMGYDQIERALSGALPTAMLAAIVFGKIVATGVTLSSGSPGGAFAPALLIGAALGSFIARLFDLDPAAGGLMGMSALVAGTFHAPLSGLLIIMKIGHYDMRMIVPLMGASALAAWFAQQLLRGNMYDLNLLRKGLDLQQTRGLKVLLEGRRACDIMVSPISTISSNASLGNMLDVVSHSRQEVYPVIDEAGRILGIITMDTIRQTLRTGNLGGLVLACDLLSPAPPTVSPDTSANELWRLFQQTHCNELLVTTLDPTALSGQRLLGFIRRGMLV